MLYDHLLASTPAEPLSDGPVEMRQRGKNQDGLVLWDAFDHRANDWVGVVGKRLPTTDKQWVERHVRWSNETYAKRDVECSR